MKRVLLATTAVAAFVAFSGTAQAQDPGMADFGATEGGGGAGSAFTVTVGGDISFFLKYATGDDAGLTVPATTSAAFAVAVAEAGLAAATAKDDYVAIPPTPGVAAVDAVGVKVAAEAAAIEKLTAAKKAFADAGALKVNDGLFALISGELHVNGAATTDNGTDISTHLELEFSGIGGDSTRDSAGSAQEPIPVGDIVRVDELSMKIGGGWGSVELGANDGAEDSFKIYGGTVASGTGGIDGFSHAVDGSVQYITLGGQAGSGDSSDALKATYMSPNIAGFQAGVSLNYQTSGPKDRNGGDLGVGVGAKYAGSAGGLDYAVSVVWGDRTLVVGGKGGVSNPKDPDDYITPEDDGYGGLGIGVKLGGAGVSFASGVTLDGLGKEGKFEVADVVAGGDDLVTDKDQGMDIYWSGGVAYAIPGAKANVALSAALGIPFGVNSKGEISNVIEQYLIFVSADYAILPGVSLALDLGYGDSNLSGVTIVNVADNGATSLLTNTETKTAGFTGTVRVKASF